MQVLTGSDIQRLFGGDQAAQQAPAPIDIDVQLIRLKDEVDALLERESVEIGDIVVEKTGLGWFNDECRKNVPMRIVRWLDMDDEQDKALAQLWNAKFHCGGGLDVLVAYIAADGGRLMFEPHNSHMLTKFSTAQS